MKKSRKKLQAETPLTRAIARDDMSAAISILKDKSLFVALPSRAIESHSHTPPPMSEANPVTSPTQEIIERPASPQTQRRMSQISALSNNSGNSPDAKAPKVSKKLAKLKAPSADVNTTPLKLKIPSTDVHDSATATVDLTAAAVHRVKIIKISLESVPVYSDTTMYGVVVCHLKHDVIVTTESHLSHKPTFWIKLNCGYIQSHDAQLNKAYHLTSITEANQFWVLEQNKRQRMASAVCAMLIKSFTLPNALRYSRSLLKHAHLHYPNANREIAPASATNASNCLNKPKTHELFDEEITPAQLALMGSASTPGLVQHNHHHKHNKDLPTVPQLITYSNMCIEDIMIALNGKVGLKKEQIFEYIKIAASSQSNPILCVLLITEDIYNLLHVRPTLWTTNHLNILETENVRQANDRFIMAAANGDIDLFKRCLGEGQELTNIHSELKYTALHAAADFGQGEIIKMIAATGLSINIKDPKKGYTALHFAAASGRCEIARLLLDHNANRKIGCNEGLKPYELAHKWGHIECTEVTKYIVPTIKYLTATESTIDSITVKWEPPTLNAVFHSPIIEYLVECLPANWYPPGEEQEHEHETILNHHIVPLDYEHPQTIYAPMTTALFSGLIASTAYKFTVKCKSLSGWCNFSYPAIFYTQASFPEKPATMEVIKVTTNGILLTWQPPIRNNGFPVEFYQIEIIENALYKEKKRSRPTTANSRPNTGNKKITFEPINKEPVTESADLTLSQEGALSAALVDDGGDDDPKGGNRLSKSHRVVKHLTVDNRFRYLTGLEPFRPYIMRTRAYNKIGPSPWSSWTVPVAPKAGVTVGGFNGQRLSAQITWFIPQLSEDRHLEAYELQICNLKGAVHKNITLMANKTKPPSPVKTSESVSTNMAELLNVQPNKNTSAEEFNEFVTIANNITTNEYEVKGLKAGGRYQCRIRCKVKEEPNFFEWDTAILSEIFAMSATVPDPPFKVRPVCISVNKDGVGDLNELSSVGSLFLGDSQSLEPMEMNTVGSNFDPFKERSSHAVNNSINATEYPEDFIRDKFAIMHDSITIEWNNGNSNGSGINKYIIEMAKVRPYRYDDILTAQSAHFQSSVDDVMLLNKKGELEEVQSNAVAHKEHVESSLKDTLTDELPFLMDGDSWELTGEPTQFEWIDVTNQGEFCGPNQFKVTGLMPGASYIFRMKQHNTCGWSEYSNSSDIVSTYTSTPPGQPQVVKVASTYCILRWRSDETVSNFINFTGLEHQVQFGMLIDQPSSNINVNDGVLVIKDDFPNKNKLNEDVEWFVVETATSLADKFISLEMCSTDDYSSVHSLMQKNDPHLTTVMVQKLVGGTNYIARVRVRTVMGWSPWSVVSEVFRTKS